MTDKELLELAAKAAGYEWSKYIAKERESTDCIGLWIDGVSTNWNPLTDDGDALRLAVKLKLGVDVSVSKTFINGPLEGQDEYVTETHNGDPCSATRRAIVRAAAEIGKDIS